MPMFGAIDTAGSSLNVHRKWLDAVADNIANMQTAKRTSDAAFQERFIVAQSTDPGVKVAEVRLGSAQGRIVHEPANPLADADGNVRYPDIDLGEQMTSMLLAQRGYQANLATVERVRDAYQAALQIGRR
jgi:flagellar basal-body rod protein FlgC